MFGFCDLLAADLDSFGLGGVVAGVAFWVLRLLGLFAAGCMVCILVG